ncbi:LppX_LprAFG lipoprotein [Candidatus Oscillochloris fontis]|uniref:LppX_LprAFG lipoprotein n=1 Tax=Candidatus Oscillochloris fontis TaxID=2496868 RepID=UPI001EE86CE6|nr:LppX_LprAFG lipoprotein [Candidatus Oscillochloris fontis]
MRNRLSLLFVSLLALLAACSAAPPTPTATPVPTPTPRELGAAIGRATQAAESAHFTIDLSGKPIMVSAFTLTRIEGDLKRPDSVLSILTVTTGSAVAEIRTASVAGQQYMTNPLTREWGCLAEGDGFNPAVLFDPQVGIEQLLQNGFDEVTLVGSEDLNGVLSYHLRGTISGEKLLPISMGMLGTGPVALDLWADQTTMRATKMVLVDTASDATNPTTWTLTFSDYGKQIEVRAPAECAKP